MLGRERYYVDEGRGHDYLLRCKDCQSLVPYAVITKMGCCPGTASKPCGNKRFTEITLLNDEEMAAIQSGAIDFPDRDLFLAEFKAVDVIEAEAAETLRLQLEARVNEEANHLANNAEHNPDTCSICYDKKHSATFEDED